MSIDYIEVKFVFTPFSADEADIMAALLAPFGFDSFENTQEGLCAYVNKDLYDPQCINAVLGQYPFSSSVEWSEKLIKGDDWNLEWEKNSFQPIVIGGDVVVHATYHTQYPQCKHDVVINPRMSFGSGHHETTSMMIEALLRTDLRGKKVIDMGAGTGILSIVACKLGAESVTGIEIDAGACSNACDNCALNDAEVKMLHGDAAMLAGVEKCDLFLANINRNIILNDIDRYVNSMKSGSLLYVSGFLEGDLDILCSQLAKRNLILTANTVRNEWVMAEFKLA
ncbi:MAG: 50S ribosomal protein L11 methyltransferase [Muribaculaceae bacterium]